MSQKLSDFGQAAPTPTPKPRVPWLWLVLAAAAGLLLVRSVSTTHREKLGSLSLEPLTFTGNSVALDDLKGKVVVLNFWGTWCPPCRMELPHIANLARYYAYNDGCRVLAVSCGGGTPDPVSSLPELKQQTDELLSTMQIDLAVYADPNGRTRRAVKEAAGFGGYPTTLVLDREGIIRRVWTGYEPGVELEIVQVVDSLLQNTGM